MTKIRILISIAMLLFGFHAANAAESGAIVYGNVAIAYGPIVLQVGEFFSAGSATFPIGFAGAPVVNITGIGSDCTSSITVTSVTQTSVEFQSARNAREAYCLSGNFMAIGTVAD